MPRPEIIAHRGASRERPENTLAAFGRAMELGADAVELDVHRTSDGVLVVHHDPVPKDGPPALAGRAFPSLTSQDVRAFRVRGEEIPALDAVARLLDGKLRLYCELKGAGTAPGATTLLTPLGDRAAVHAFDHRQVAEARRIAPSVPRGVLEASYHLEPTRALQGVAGRDLWEQWELIDQGLVDAIHAIGGRVVAWTVNGADEMLRLSAMGVDALCTDDVTLARKTLPA